MSLRTAASLVPPGSPRLCCWGRGAMSVRTHAEEMGNGSTVCTQSEGITRQQGVCKKLCSSSMRNCHFT